MLRRRLLLSALGGGLFLGLALRIGSGLFRGDRKTGDRNAKRIVPVIPGSPMGATKGFFNSA